MVEIGLFVNFKKDGSFQIYSKIRPYTRQSNGACLEDSVITVDYNYTPWPRKGGNLLWHSPSRRTLR